jgi:hypothetical protein
MTRGMNLEIEVPVVHPTPVATERSNSQLEDSSL